jgi:hypothetical protein
MPLFILAKSAAEFSTGVIVLFALPARFSS